MKSFKNTRKTSVECYQSGQEAYAAGKGQSACPYSSSAYSYTDEGLKYTKWITGWFDAWTDDGRPKSREYK